MERSTTPTAPAPVQSMSTIERAMSSGESRRVRRTSCTTWSLTPSGSTRAARSATACASA